MTNRIPMGAAAAVLLLSATLSACENGPVDAVLDESLDSSDIPAVTGAGDPSSGSAALLYQKGLRGKEGSSQYFTFTVPSGASRLVVETFAEGEWGYNQNDLFVSADSMPSVTSHSPYEWSATCASVEPDLRDDTCSLENPAPGTWHVLVYGKKAYYGTSLKVTIEE